MGAKQSRSIAGSGQGADGGAYIGNPYGAIREALQNGMYGGDETCDGAGSFVGGKDDENPMKSIAEYRESVRQKAKEKVVKQLASALQEITKNGDGSFNITPDMSMEEIAKALDRIMPKPSNDGTYSIKKDAKAHKAICMDIARALNRTFTPHAKRVSDMLIDTRLPVNKICNLVSEYIHAMATGMHMEFMTVYKAVNNSLRNCKIIRETMRIEFAGIMDRIKEFGSDKVKDQIEPLRIAYKRADEMLDKEMLLLNNFFNTTLADAKQEIETAIRVEDESHNIAIRLGIVPGTKNFSEALAAMLSDFGVLAAIADKVDKALKTLGMTVNDYLKLNNISDLNSAVENVRNKADEKDIGKTLKSIQVLREYFSRRQDITDELSKEDMLRKEIVELPDLSDKFSDLSDNIGEPQIDGSAEGGRDRAHGGDYNDGVAPSDETPTDFRARQKRDEKKLIINEFAKSLQNYYMSLTNHIKTLGPKLGAKIPVSDKMRELRDALVRLDDGSSNYFSNIENALTGVLNTADARQQKEVFIGNVKDIISNLDDLCEMNMYASVSDDFKSIRGVFSGILSLIDKYTDVLQKKYGADEDEDEDENEDNIATKTGGDALTSSLESTTSYELKTAVNNFKYFYFVAGIRANMKQTYAELESYGEGYTALLGTAVAERVQQLEKAMYKKIEDIQKGTGSSFAPQAAPNPPKDQEEYLKKLVETAAGGAGEPAAISGANDMPTILAGTALGTGGGVGGAGDAGKAPKEKAKKALKEQMDKATDYIKQQHKVVRMFYDALQALDLYLQALTKAVIKNPDDLNAIKRIILDGENENSAVRWFTDKTGDDLVEAFDMMPAVDDASPAGLANADSVITIDRPDGNRPKTDVVNSNNDNSKHYYNGVREQIVPAGVAHAHADKIGVPQLMQKPSEIDNVQKKVSAAILNFQALKNITNLFARIGDKFGTEELHRNIFMSPAQIFKILTGYIKTIALNIGIKPTAAPNFVYGGANCAKATDAQWGVNNFCFNFASVYDGVKGEYDIEDKLFTFMVKAMASKIVTVIGIQDLFEKPGSLDLGRLMVGPRMVLGGAASSAPLEVLDGAVELYFRLPRLVEFYRNTIDINRGGAASQQIAFIPEMDSIYSGIVSHIFLSNNSGDGNYQDYEIESIIRDVNSIYLNYRDKAASPDVAIRESIMGLIHEINRRIGIVKRTQWEAYDKRVSEMTADMYKLQGSSVADATNYAILPDEDLEDVSYGMAPSAALISQQDRIAPSSSIGISKMGIEGKQLQYWNYLNTFRSKVDGKFLDKAVIDNFANVSYSMRIKIAKDDLLRAPTNDERVKIASKLIVGSRDMTQSIDATHALMFHETVILGLNVLNAIYSILAEFRHKVYAMDLRQYQKIIQEKLAPVDLTSLAAANPFDQNYLAERILLKMPAKWREAVPYGLTKDDIVTYLIKGAAAAYAAGNAYIARPGAIGANGDMLSSGRGSIGTYFADDFYADIASAIGGDAAGGGFGALVPDAKAIANFKKIASRFVVNYHQIMRDLVESVFALTCDTQKMVDISFPGSGQNQIRLDFNNLRKYAEGLMEDVRGYIEKFRPIIPKDVIENYTLKDNVGSFYWLEEHLRDGFFRGTLTAGGKITEDPDKYHDDLNALGKRVNDIFCTLIVDTGVYTVDNAVANPLTNAIVAAQIILPAGFNDYLGATHAASKDTGYEHYGEVFSGLVFYDASSPNAAAISTIQVTKRLNDAAAPSLIKKQLVMTKRPVSAGTNTDKGYPTYKYHDPARNDHTIDFYLDIIQDSGFIAQTSMLLMFNQILYKYLLVFYDDVSQKIYKDLIDSFGNGTFSNLVMQNNTTFPDLYISNAHPFGVRGDPKPQAVLFQTLGFMLQRLLTDANPKGASDHLISTLSDIQTFMKERYRANLPLFARYFGSLSSKGGLIKELLNRTSVKVKRQRYAVTTAFAAANAGWHIADKPGAGAAQIPDARIPNINTALETFKETTDKNTSELVKQRIIAIIDQIQSGCYALNSCINMVMTALPDNSQFFDVQENSISMYKQRNGKIPTMPYSLTSLYLEDVGPVVGLQYELALPESAVGSASFKVLYGTHKLLLGNEEINYELMPGVKALVEDYNSIADKRQSIDPSAYIKFVSDMNTMLKYVVGIRNVNRRFLVDDTTRTSNFASVVLMSENNVNDKDVRGINKKNSVQYFREGLTNANIGGAVVAHAPASTSLLPSNIAQIVENSYQDDFMQKIAILDSTKGAGLSGKSAAEQRTLEQTFSIIDMNVIPINVHALMRDIPFANIYNYVYGFHQAVASLYNVKLNDLDNKTLDGAAASNDTRTAFTKLLVDPYTLVDEERYGSNLKIRGTDAPIQRICRGDDGLGLGRPKFISDQLFNKVMFSSLYPIDIPRDVSGPQAAAATYRGITSTGFNAAAYHGFLEGVNDVYTRAINNVAAGGGGGGGNADVTLNATLANFMLAQNAIPANQFAITQKDYNLGIAYALAQIARDSWNFGGGAGAVQTNAVVFPAAPPGQVYLRTHAQEFINGYEAAKHRPEIAKGMTWYITTMGNPVAFVRINAWVQDQNNLCNNNGADAAATIDQRMYRALGALLLQLQSFELGNRAVDMGAQFTVPRIPQLINELSKSATTTTKYDKDSTVDASVSGMHNLSYLKKIDLDNTSFTTNDVVRVDIRNSNLVRELENIGKKRFDTKLVRNMFFLVNVMRMIRVYKEGGYGSNMSSLGRLDSRATEYGAIPNIGMNEGYSNVSWDGR